MVTSTKKATASKRTSTKAKSVTAVKRSAASKAVGEGNAVTSHFKVSDDVAREAEGLVAPDAMIETAGFAPLPIQGVTRNIPESDEDENEDISADQASNDKVAGTDKKLVKKDMIDRVIARSGVKPRYVRQVADAMLEELGLMLEEVETLQIQPLGTLKVQRRKDVDDGEVIICKLKRRKPDATTNEPTNDPLAAAAE